MLSALLARASATAARLVPSQCAVCRAWPAQPVCTMCHNRFAGVRHRCRTCALPIEGGAVQCGACLRHPPPLAACIAAVDYAYPWAGLIGRFKFHAEPGWAAVLAELARSAPGAEALLASADRVLPMPLAPARLRERGYNQAFILALQLAPAQADAHLLLRTRDTAPQLGLDRAARLRNVRGAFAVEPLRAGEFAGRTVVLVDDVMTTGASLHAAAEALLRAGAASVGALVIARTPAD